MAYVVTSPLKSLPKIILGFTIIWSAFACQTPEINELIYGKWYEPVEGSGIELRSDGVALWYGEEGSFEVTVSRVDTLACGLSQLGCYYGDVTINVGGRVHQTRYYDRILTESVDRWTMTFDAPVTVPSGRQLSALRLQKVDRFMGPQTRPGFTRMDAGLEDYYTGDGTFFQVADQWIRDHYSLERGTPTLSLWSDEDERWTEIGPEDQPQDSRRFVVGTSLIYATDGYYSQDVGHTFERTQAISEIPTDAEETKAVILNREVIALQRIRRDDDEISTEVWGLDLTSARPTWTRRHRFADGDFLAYLLAAPNADALIIGWLNDEGPLRSLDGGRTWTQINLGGIPCEDNFLVNAHPTGCWCATQENRYVYDARHDRWMTLTEGGWSNQAVGVPQAALTDEYPLFVIERGRLFLVSWSGTRTSTIQVPADTEGWRLHVTSGRVLYAHHLLWSTLFPW